MFIKFIRNRHETVYDCQYYSCQQVDSKLEFNIHLSNGKVIDDNIECTPECELYIVNNFGKTIDRKTW